MSQVPEAQERQLSEQAVLLGSGSYLRSLTLILLIKRPVTSNIYATSITSFEERSKFKQLYRFLYCPNEMDKRC